MAKLNLKARTSQVWPACNGFLAKRWGWVLGLALILIVLVLFLKAKWPPWTGFGGYYDSEDAWQQEKTLWDWMDLVLVPLVLAGGAAFVHPVDEPKGARA